MNTNWQPQQEAEARSPRREAELREAIAPRMELRDAVTPRMAVKR